MYAFSACGKEEIAHVGGLSTRRDGHHRRMIMRIQQAQAKRPSLLLVLFAALAIGGCATPATAPDTGVATTGNTRTGSQLLLTTADGRASFHYTIADTDTVVADYPSSVKTCDRLLEARADVAGHEGGVLHCGRFTLRIPPDAFEGTATIKMSVPDSLLMLCDMDISPGSLN